MQIKPFEDRVLVEPEEMEESRTKSGIIIPDTAKEKPRTGKVIEVGTDEELAENIKVGDKIVFAKFTGDELEFEGKKYLIVSRSDILAVIKYSHFGCRKMDLVSQAIEVLERIGIRRGQTVLDFGCGYGAYTIPVARIVGAQGRVYALDKDEEALDGLMQRADLACLKNIERMETSGELEIELTDESVDVVLLFDVFHSFYFPQAEDRRRLLGEIRRVMKPSAFLSISVWPNLIEPETEDEIENADFRLEKVISEGLGSDNKDLGTRRILNFRKKRYVLSLTNQSRRRQYEQSSRSYRSEF